jgi:hypothetical protein
MRATGNLTYLKNVNGENPNAQELLLFGRHYFSTTPTSSGGITCLPHTTTGSGVASLAARLGKAGLQQGGTV